MNVALVGASPKPDRYAYMAFKRLLEKGHHVYLVHPIHKEIEGHPVFPTLSAIPDPIDTLTFYVSAEKSSSMTADILALHPRRLIFNPGAENSELAKAAEATGILTMDACTLVMLSTHQF